MMVTKMRKRSKGKGISRSLNRKSLFESRQVGPAELGLGEEPKAGVYLARFFLNLKLIIINN